MVEKKTGDKKLVKVVDSVPTPDQKDGTEGIIKKFKFLFSVRKQALKGGFASPDGSKNNGPYWYKETWEAYALRSKAVLINIYDCSSFEADVLIWIFSNGIKFIDPSIKIVL